jgi:hypothetical protein
MGKSTINGPFSIAMLNYQRVLFLIHQNRAKSVGFSRIPLPAGGLPSCEEGLCRKPFFFRSKHGETMGNWNFSQPLTH